MLRCVILDFDGVILESNEAKDRAFEDLFALYPEHADAMRAFHVGNRTSPRRVKFERFAALLGRPDDGAEMERMERHFSEAAFRRVSEAPEVPGARAFLEELARRLPLYVASVTPDKELRRIIAARRLAPYFKGVFGDPPHPKTVAIRAVLEREGLMPGEVLLVGDSPSDREAAASRGLAFLGRDNGRWAGERSFVFRDMREIGSEVRRRLGHVGAQRG